MEEKEKQQIQSNIMFGIYRFASKKKKELQNERIEK